MKNLFILTIALISTFILTSCEKTEILTEEFESTQKSSTQDLLNGTSWQVHALKLNNTDFALTWKTKFPKLDFENGVIKIKLGRNMCTKSYYSNINMISVISDSNCQIDNTDHRTLYDFLEGEFELVIPTGNPDALYLKNDNGTVYKLRKINTLSTSTGFNL